MYNNAIEIICNGDFPGRSIARSLLTVGELEEMAEQSEKAAVGAATDSEQN